MRTAALVLASVLLCAAPAAAAPATDALLEQGVQAYTEALDTPGRAERLEAFRKAERLFARALEDGIASPDLYTNLGNAALQAERLGSAILAYRRALLLDPDHARASQNLEHARSLMPEWVPRPEAHDMVDSFFFWHRTLARSERSIGAALAFLAAALLVAASLRLDSAALRNLAVVPGLVWLALVASLVLDPAQQGREEAVVTADEVVARAADSSLAPDLFSAPLPGGTELRVVEERSPWLRVRLANGRDAWVQESSVSRVAPALSPTSADAI
jgi:hypothetical protein